MNMGTNREQKKRRYGVYLDEDVYYKLKELSKDRRLSVSALITQYILKDESLSERGREEMRKKGFDPNL